MGCLQGSDRGPAAALQKSKCAAVWSAALRLLEGSHYHPCCRAPDGSLLGDKRPRNSVRFAADRSGRLSATRELAFDAGSPDGSGLVAGPV